VGRRGGVRTLLWVGVAIVGFGAALVLSAPLWLRPIAEWQAAAALGCPVAIGRLHLRPGSPLVITAEDVVIGNPAGFPTQDEPPFARIPRLTLQLDALVYLRRREVVIPAVEIERPEVRAVATEDGRDNFSFDLASSPPAGEAAEPAPPAAGPKIGVLRILDGRAQVSLARLRAEVELRIATREEPGQGSAIVVEAQGTYAGQPVTGRLVGGGLLALRDAGDPWPIELELENGPTRGRLRGTLQDPLNLRGAAVGLLLRGPDMALLQPLTGILFPTTPPYEAGGKLDYAAGRFRLTDMAGTVGRSDLEGWLTVAPGSEGRPLVEAELRSRRVDLRDLAGFAGGEPTRPGTPGQTPEQRRRAAQAEADPRALPDAPLDLPKLDAADVRLAYRAERIQGRAMPLDDLAVRMEMAGGAVRLQPISFGVGRGMIIGALALEPQGAPAEGGAVRMRAEIRFERLDLSRLMDATGGAFQGAGTLNGAARVEGAGRSVAEVLGRGDGALVLTMAGGGDLSKLLVDLSGLRFGEALLSALGMPARTRVECFVGDLVLRRGTLLTQALLLETEDAITEGRGGVDLARERIELRLRTESKRLTFGAVPTPLLVGGTLREPRVVPEPSELIARGGIAGALAAIAPPLAALPTIQFGVGDDPRCERLVARARGGGAPPQQAATGGEAGAAPAAGPDGGGRGRGSGGRRGRR
jgi:uncharacterized protein involved in outer membrane biogenesis